MKTAVKKDLKKEFSRLLLAWNTRTNRREMPWKGEKDPYKIWLSEIILQQTRVEQGLAYYNRFISTFPDIQSLANAPESQVFKLWEGLGYYTRCRNLVATARYITGELNGKFPGRFEDILSLKGVGPYTAAAISSFAFNLPHAVVDGNVFRVLARVFGMATPTDSPEGKRLFTALANELLDKVKPGIYNQAIMDFGAMVCKPKSPLCEECVMRRSCTAYTTGKVNLLPVKEKKVSVRKRWFYYLLVEYGNEVIVQQRTASDIWRQLYEFTLVETEKELDTEGILEKALQQNLIPGKGYELVEVSGIFRQQLTHQLITGQFLRVKLSKKHKAVNGGVWIRKADLQLYAFPQIINQHMKNAILA